MNEMWKHIKKQNRDIGTFIRDNSTRVTRIHDNKELCEILEITQPKDFSLHDYKEKDCFRQLLSKSLGLENYNLSIKGSSNQTQFRLALNTFFSKDKIYPVTSDIVLWGITSVYRTELWHNDMSGFKSIFLPDNAGISKILATQHHNEKEEIKILGQQMRLWNSYFKSINVKNYWFNVFNDHSWDIEIDNLFFQNSC